MYHASSIIFHYMQPQTHTDYMRDRNTTEVLFYFIVKMKIF